MYKIFKNLGTKSASPAAVVSGAPEREMSNSLPISSTTSPSTTQAPEWYKESSINIKNSLPEHLSLPKIPYHPPYLYASNPSANHPRNAGSTYLDPTVAKTPKNTSSKEP